MAVTFVMRGHRWVGRTLAALASLSLSACALLSPAEKKGPDAAASPQSASSSPTVEPSYRLEVEAPGPLKKLLLSYLDLARFQSAPQSERITPDELVRLAAAAPAQAKALLETEGYFRSNVSLVRGETEAGLPLFTLSVEPGTRTQVASFRLQIEGDLFKQAEAGNPDAKKLIAQLDDRWPLPPGDPFRQADWTSAKNTELALLRAEGYPTANWGATEARIDARNHVAALSGTLQSGPLFRLGPLRIEGLSRYDDRAIRNLADFYVGSPYSEKVLLDYQDRLSKLRLFDSVSVEIDPDISQAAATPVTVRVREQKRQQATVGVGYSDKSGPRATLEHRDLRPFGWGGQVYNKFELGSALRSWEGELISDPTPDRYRHLLATSVSHLRAATDEVTDSARVRVGRSFDTERIGRLMFVELLDSSLRNTAVDQNAQALSLNYNWTWRDLDSIVLPTKGVTTNLQLAGGHAESNFGSPGPFARVYNRSTLYWPLGKGWYSQLRLEIGQVFAATGVGIPDALLFRAGGDESVRGYGYRTLGPLENGVLASGHSLVATSAEVARPLSSKLPNLWGAAFVDAGNAAENFRDLRPALGYGLGLRFRSPVGPLRIDLAYGQKVRKVRLHLSVGIAF